MPTKAQRRCCERWRVCAEENGGEPLLITYLDMGTFIPDSNSNYTPPLRRAASIPGGRWWWPLAAFRCRGLVPPPLFAPGRVQSLGAEGPGPGFRGAWKCKKTLCFKGKC